MNVSEFSVSEWAASGDAMTGAYGYICPQPPSFDLLTPNFAKSSNLNSVPGSVLET